MQSQVCVTPVACASGEGLHKKGQQDFQYNELLIKRTNVVNRPLKKTQLNACANYSLTNEGLGNGHARLVIVGLHYVTKSK